MSFEQLNYYHSKLAYETDPSDVYNRIKNGDNIVVIDGRSKDAYEKEHIPNAINIPHRDISQKLLSDLDKSKLYVTYCDGIGCNASTKTAYKMLTLGFNVKEMLGGLDWWKRDGYETHGNEAMSGLPVECGC